jgi:O-antigen/teichoic acid export membrane protein
LDQANRDQQKIITGSRWVALTTLATSSLGLVTTLLFPKFIAPEEYGLFALGTMVMSVFQTLGQFGQSEFIIYKGRKGTGVQKTVFTTLLLSHLLFLGLQLAFANALASFFHHPRLAGLYRWMSLGYGISALGIVPGSLLIRDLEFKKKFWPDLMGVVAYTAVGLSLAIARAGVWALIGATWAMGVVQVILFWTLSGCRFELGLDRSALREMLHYGTPLFLFGLAAYLFRNIDQMALGHWIGVRQVGYYAVALQFALLLPTKAYVIIGNVALPSYAMVRGEEERVRGLYIKALYVSSFVAGAIATATILLAEPFVRLVYGPAWVPTIVPLKLLACYGMIAIMSGPSVIFFTALGLTRTLFYVGLGQLGLAALFMPLALRFGLPGVAGLMTLILWIGGSTAIGLAMGFLKVRFREVTSPLIAFPLAAGTGLLAGSALARVIGPSSWPFWGLAPAVMGVALYLAFTMGPNRDIRRILGQFVKGRVQTDGPLPGVRGSG